MIKVVVKFNDETTGTIEKPAYLIRDGKVLAISQTVDSPNALCLTHVPSGLRIGDVWGWKRQGPALERLAEWILDELKPDDKWDAAAGHVLEDSGWPHQWRQEMYDAIRHQWRKINVATPEDDGWDKLS